MIQCALFSRQRVSVSVKTASSVLLHNIYSREHASAICRSRPRLGVRADGGPSLRAAPAAAPGSVLRPRGRAGTRGARRQRAAESGPAPRLAAVDVTSASPCAPPRWRRYAAGSAGAHVGAAEPRRAPGPRPEAAVGARGPPGGRSEAAGLGLGLAALELRAGAGAWTGGGVGPRGGGALSTGLHLQGLRDPVLPARLQAGLPPGRSHRDLPRLPQPPHHGRQPGLVLRPGREEEH